MTDKNKLNHVFCVIILMLDECDRGIAGAEPLYAPLVGALGLREFSVLIELLAEKGIVERRFGNEVAITGEGRMLARRIRKFHVRTTKSC